MAKRSFEQQDGVLCDDSVDEDGQCQRYTMPDPRPRTPAEREALLERVAKGPGEHGSATAAYALSFDPRPDLLEALLEGLENGARPTLGLLSFLHDPRVRPAILSAAARMRLVEDREANVLQLLGIIGGEPAKAMLRAAIDGFLAHPRVWEDDDFVNPYASCLITACEGLLELDADATFAADTLVRMIEHPCAGTRGTAVGTSAELLERSKPRTEAFERLRSALRALLDADLRLFVNAAPMLLRTDHAAARKRCNDILRNRRGEPEDRLVLLFALARGSGSQWLDDALDVLIAAIRAETSLSLAFMMADVVGWRWLPPELAESLVRRGLAHESPHLRYSAVECLRWLPAELAAMLAEQARLDEPDPVILWRLETRSTPAD